jgi:hypothetical protein
VLVSLYILLVPFVVRPTEIIVAACIIASGVPIYLVFISFGSKPMSAQKLNGTALYTVFDALLDTFNPEFQRAQRGPFKKYSCRCYLLQRRRIESELLTALNVF